MKQKFIGAKKRIGIVGTGFIATGLIHNLHKQSDLQVTKVLTRRDISSINSIPNPSVLTNSLDDFIDHIDIIVECSGDTIHATEVAQQAIQHNLPLVTMNAEFQVTTASYFVDKGFVTEAEGDQPGCIAALAEEAIHMGFRPLVYGNIKGFLDRNPSRANMEYWAKKQGISIPMVTSFADGTKVQIEQVLVANGLDASIVQQGLQGPQCTNVEDGGRALAQGVRADKPISDYVLCGAGPAGVFIVAEHDEEQISSLRYLKMGEGPYVLVKNYHLCHLEITRTLRQVISDKKVLLNNTSSPRYSVAAVAKTPIQADQVAKIGVGSFKLRGEAISIADIPNHVPIGLIKDAVLTRDVAEGDIITFDDIDLPETLALNIWQDIRQKALS